MRQQSEGEYTDCCQPDFWIEVSQKKEKKQKQIIASVV